MAIKRVMRMPRMISAMIAALLAALLLAPFAATPALAADSDDGYWQLVGTEVRQGEGGGPNIGVYYTYTQQASELEHTEIYEKRDYPDNELWERAVCVSTCSSAPPAIIRPGDTVSLTVTIEITEYWTKGLNYCDGYGMSAGINANGSEPATATLVRESPNSDTHLRSNSTTYTVAWRSGQSDGAQLTIMFGGCGSSTVWTYEWVSEHVDYRPITQNEYGPASDTPGEESPWGIIPSIIEGFDPSEDGLYTVIGGATLVTIGGVTFLRFRRKRNKNAKRAEKKEPQEQKPQSAYRMLIYKDFGGELRAGEAPREVCARIEEIVGGYAASNVFGGAVPGATVPPGATVRRRDDLTRDIKAWGEAGLMVVGQPTFNGMYMVARVQVPKQPAGAPANQQLHPTVVFSYVNPQGAGTFTQKVAFRLAAEPTLVFVGKGRDGSFSPAFGTNRIGLLLSDAQGSPLFFEAANFIKAPTHTRLVCSDARLSGEGERVGDALRPNAFVYRMPVRNAIPFESIFGTWPIELKFSVQAWNEEGERAEAAATAFIWPDGIYVDTRQVRRERVFKDHLLVDTTDILLSAGTEYNIEGATVEVGVAFKNDEGVVFLDIPNGPADGSYLKLEPGPDELSSKVLDPNSPRVWYTLGYVWHPTYSEKHEPLGTLDLKPLMPLVSARESTEYRGSVPIRYSKDGRFAQADVVFALKGLGSGMYEADLKTERDRIYRLLSAFRPNDWSRIDAVLATYGRQAERDQQRLGTPEERRLAGQSATELMKSIAHIQSLQRMRAIRKMVYEAAEVTQVHEKVKADSEAAKYNAFFVVASTVRWADDIAFTAWWYAMCGPKAAAYVEPLMTPLKNWLLGYVEQCGLALFVNEVKLQPEKYFTWRTFYDDVVVNAIEGELLGLIAGALATGGTSLAKNPKTYMSLGAAGCFFFYKNYTRFIICNPATGKTELDLWGAIKATMADFTLFGIKAIVSIMLARRFAAKMEPQTGAKSELFHVDESAGPVEQFVQRKLKWFIEEPLLVVDEAASTVFLRTTRDIGNGLRNPDVFSKHLFSNKGSWYAAMSRNEQFEIWQAFYDALQQKGADVAGSVRTQEGIDTVGNLTGGVESGFEGWVRGLGSVEVGAVTTDDKKTTVRVPYLALFSIIIDQLFAMCGLDIGISFKGLLPEGMDYRYHDQLVVDLARVGGADAECEFLIDPPDATTETSYNTSTVTGNYWPSYDGGGSGTSTGRDTGTDTSTSTSTDTGAWL